MKEHNNDFENRIYENFCGNINSSPAFRGNYGKIFNVDKDYVVKICDCKNMLSVIPEIAILSSLNHRSILKAHYIIKKNDEIMFVISKYDCTLRDISTECPNIKLNVTEQLCNALNYLHSKFFLHLDLSLKNILVKIKSNFLHVCICDFSLSKFAPKGKINTRYSKVTVNYRPYENLIGSNEYSFKTDCWSLGVCLYYLYEGKDLIKFNYISDNVNTSKALETCSLFEIQKLYSEGNWPPTENSFIKMLLDLNIEQRIDTYQLSNILGLKTYKKERLKSKEIISSVFNNCYHKTSKTNQKELYKECISIVKGLMFDTVDSNFENAFEIISLNKGILTF